MITFTLTIIIIIIIIIIAVVVAVFLLFLSSTMADDLILIYLMVQEVGGWLKRKAFSNLPHALTSGIGDVTQKKVR
jgi:hypothetical protein